MNTIGTGLIRWKRITHSGVGGITRGQWLVGIVSGNFVGWEHDQKSGFNRTLKHILNTIEEWKEQVNKMRIETSKITTKENRIGFDGIEKIMESSPSIFTLQEIF